MPGVGGLAGVGGRYIPQKTRLSLAALPLNAVGPAAAAAGLGGRAWRSNAAGELGLRTLSGGFHSPSPQLTRVMEWEGVMEKPQVNFVETRHLSGKQLLCGEK